GERTFPERSRPHARRLRALDGLHRRAFPVGRIMAHAAPDIRPITLREIEAARVRIAGTIARTPLVRLETGSTARPIYLKLENLQPINSFKLRGAANAVANLRPELRSKGVWTISAGNAGQGVAYAARQAGVPCKVVTIETAPDT